MLTESYEDLLTLSDASTRHLIMGPNDILLVALGSLLTYAWLYFTNSSSASDSDGKQQAVSGGKPAAPSSGGGSSDAVSALGTGAEHARCRDLIAAERRGRATAERQLRHVLTDPRGE
jgi:hypothetical protein